MKPTVVAVDDEPIVLDSIGEQLQRRFRDDYDIELAQDAAEALRQRHPPGRQPGHDREDAFHRLVVGGQRRCRGLGVHPSHRIRFKPAPRCPADRSLLHSRS